MSSNQSNISFPLPEIPDNVETQDSKSAALPPKKLRNWWLVLLYSTMTATGILTFPLIQRLYFTHGGSSKWLASLLQSVGALVLLPPLSFLYFKSLPGKKLAFFMDPKLALSSAALGLLFGLDTFLYSAGLSSIPVSTASLLMTTQLAFTALFAFILVKQKFTFYSVNAVVVVTSGAVVLAIHTSGDQPLGESKKKYLLGFFLTLAAAALQGLAYPLVELAYSKSNKPMTYLIVLQFLLVNGLFSALFSVAGILISKDYKMIAKEVAEFDLGEKKYYVIIVAIVVTTLLTSIGSMGLISCTSSFFNGILGAVLLPLIEAASVITFGDKFNGQKGLSLFLCLWGFTSYFLGEHKKTAKTEPMVELNVVNDLNHSRDEV